MKSKKGIVGVTAFMVFFVAVLVLSIGIPYWTAETVTFTVKSKERITQQSGDTIESKYLIYTDIEVFENTDCLMRWKFNSSDVYNNLDNGKKYKALVYGWRIPFCSSYRNIVKATRIAQ